ncbi:hypothetical protein D3C75_1070220 [compost metagenome]
MRDFVIRNDHLIRDQIRQHTKAGTEDQANLRGDWTFIFDIDCCFLNVALGYCVHG